MSMCREIPRDEREQMVSYSEHFQFMDVKCVFKIIRCVCRNPRNFILFYLIRINLLVYLFQFHLFYAVF